MSRTESTMLALGSVAPDFQLPDVTTGQPVSLDDVAKERGVLVMFISRHCPYVKHIADQLSALGRDYETKPLGMVAISANDVVNYPDDSPENLALWARELGLVYPVLFDESQSVAKGYTAACTPDFFLFDGHRKLVYRGQLDDSRPGLDEPCDGADIRAALDAVLAGRPVSAAQKPSIGCNIKWRAGNEPHYFG